MRPRQTHFDCPFIIGRRRRLASVAGRPPASRSHTLVTKFTPPTRLDARSVDVGIVGCSVLAEQATGRSIIDRSGRRDETRRDETGARELTGHLGQVQDSILASIPVPNRCPSLPYVRRA
jgi:hypothetical protein